MVGRAVVGFIEPVKIITSKGKRHVKARIDTGATRSSIDLTLARTIGVGPVIGERTVKNAHGIATRQIVELTVELAGRTLTTKFTIADRTHMNFPVLIGRSALRRGFLIDPRRKIE